MNYKFSCPVPKDQRPINEYMELIQSNFFNWPVLAEILFTQKILKTFFFCFVLCFPFSSLFINFNQSFYKLVLVNSLIATFVLLLITLRLILAWNYIKNRLYNPTIFYEESGWYDGRLWVKSKNILVQDRLVHAYQVLPRIKKLNYALIWILCFFSAFLVLFYLN